MPNQPNPYDAVYGGQPVSPHDGVVLGGLEGVRQQLNAPYEAVRVAALHKALDYGEAGLDLVIEVLRDDIQRMGWDAYWVLSQRPAAKAQAALTECGLLHHYEVVTVNKKGYIFRREQNSTRIFRESLGEVSLDLVPIPGGTFLMGSPKDELKRLDCEGPQHEVTVPPFFMGRFPITQAQWRAVAQLEPIDWDLAPDPSRFKCDNRPVERVLWSDATEFCARLSQLTGRDYRLPSEAEWEYACRAGTTTPFHFGETITPDLAIYNGNYTYSWGPEGTDQEETTEVGSFPPNAFGLYDMHGNIWEWCQDHGHDNYEGAPTDGSAWLFSDERENENRHTRLVRGGSWSANPRNCRSASRKNVVDARGINLGFRVVCSIEALRGDAQRLRQAAYFMLLHRPEAKAQAALTEYGQLHHYEVVTVDPQGQILQREPKQTHLFRESLGNVSLDMVPIPGGTFLMGSPEDELERLDFEGPQHEVTVPPFFMGRFPITQAQWRFVAQLEQVDRELDPDPSGFKGDNRPLDKVSWYDATEFCARLSQLTGRGYRLPSEAEWEYACRAGTTTPFHFGPTITTDIANYQGTDWEYKGKTYPGSYGQGPKGEYRQKTTDVGCFPPNAFGLYDMHGNIGEWCQDHWHDNYKDAPTNGSAWLFPAEKESKNEGTRVLRCASWVNSPMECRSAYRNHLNPDARISCFFGFRVVCTAVGAFL